MDVMVASSVAARPYALNTEANGSGLSWAAVIGGAVATAALALILLMLGLGLGLSSISPWSPAGHLVDRDRSRDHRLADSDAGDRSRDGRLSSREAAYQMGKHPQ